MSGYAIAIMERMAKDYADKAIMAERHGKYEEAIKSYRKAADILRKILRLDPYNRLKETYIEFIKTYEDRANFLEKNLEKITVSDENPHKGGGSTADVDISEYIKEPPKITFEDIVDLESVKKELKKSILYPVRRPDLFINKIGWAKGILLYGPPGNGKTMLAGAVANEVKGAFITVDAANIMSKWLGDAEKNVHRIFEAARTLARQGTPVILFIDEVDSLMGVFSSEVGGEVRVRTQFLKEMDGIQSKGVSELIFVIGATNKPWVLDQPFLRRFQKRIYVPNPNKEVRKAMFQHYLRNIRVAEDIDLDKLAEITEGYSSSDIVDIVREAYNRVVDELFESGMIDDEPRPIRFDDLLEVIKHRRPSVSPELIKAYEDWASKFGTI